MNIYFPILVSISITLSLLLICSFTPEGIIFAYIEANQEYVENKFWQMDNPNNILKANLLANGLEKRLKDAAAILEITGDLPRVRSTQDAILLNMSNSVTGIPEKSDHEKRGIAKAILSDFEGFEVIFFLMPNGDMYLEEPFTAQENLTTSNFGYREYFKGAVSSGKTYLGDVIISAASGLPQAEIAVPLYFPNNHSLVGVWTGAIDFDLLQEGLQSLDLTQNERVIFVDSNGTKVADSDKELATNTRESFSDLKSFRNALNGQVGSIIEPVNGTMMSISYQPVQALQNTWAVLWMQKSG